MNKISSVLFGLAGLGMVAKYWVLDQNDDAGWPLTGLGLLVCATIIWFSPQIEKALGLPRGRERDDGTP